MSADPVLDYLEKTFAESYRATLAGVKLLMIDQYALAAANNRTINARRGRERVWAGFFTLASVLAIVMLVAVGIATHLELIGGHA